MSRRVLFHVQHLLGIGHLRRTARLARACAERGLDVTVASGGLAVAEVVFGDAALVQLPPLRATDESFRTLVDDGGRPIDDAWRGRRRDVLLDLFARVAPDVLVVEMFPFGRRQLRFELLPLLEAARASGVYTVSSVRDVLTAREPERTAEAAAWAIALFDAVLVHGDPAVIGFDESFSAAAEIHDRLSYTGYIAPPPEAPGGPDSPGWDEVVVSAGGGAVGERLLRTALEARAAADAGRRWRLLAGGNLDDGAFAALCDAAPEGVVVERARDDFPALLANCAVSVSQGGYNTLVEALHARARMVIIPFSRGGQTEQSLRAGRFEALGLARCVGEDELSPPRLAAAIDAALAAPPPPRGTVNMDGAARSAGLIARWAEGADG